LSILYSTLFIRKPLDAFYWVRLSPRKK